MKKILFLVVIACISMTIQAQKCKYDYEKKDPFTGKISKMISIKLDRDVVMGIYSTDTNYAIGLSAPISGVSNYTISKGDSLLFAMEDTIPLSFSCMDKVIPTTNVQGSGRFAAIITTYVPYYLATSEQIRQLTLNNIIALKIRFGNNALLIELTPKMQRRVIEAAKCILK